MQAHAFTENEIVFVEKKLKFFTHTALLSFEKVSVTYVLAAKVKKEIFTSIQNLGVCETPLL